MKHCPPNLGFMDHYEDWREKRINKLISLVGGKEWFKGKTVLELACGYGHVGSELQELGANVTFAEGRLEYHKEIKARAKEGSEILLIDNDRPWKLDKIFDLVIYWGILYHLENWERDLRTVIDHGSLICFETCCLDPVDPGGVTLFTPAVQQYAPVHIIKESGFDQAIHGIGSYPPASHIERIITEAGGAYTRYDDADLNSGRHDYSWKSGERQHFLPFWRRYWMITNKKYEKEY